LVAVADEVMNFHVDFLDGSRKARLPIHKLKVDRPMILSTA
jgi:hypothetical protein